MTTNLQILVLVRFAAFKKGLKISFLVKNQNSKVAHDRESPNLGFSNTCSFLKRLKKGVFGEKLILEVFFQ